MELFLVKIVVFFEMINISFQQKIIKHKVDEDCTKFTKEKSTQNILCVLFENLCALSV
jgi:hypothetical protein